MDTEDRSDSKERGTGADNLQLSLPARRQKPPLLNRPPTPGRGAGYRDQTGPPQPQLSYGSPTGSRPQGASAEIPPGTLLDTSNINRLTFRNITRDDRIRAEKAYRSQFNVPEGVCHQGATGNTLFSAPCSNPRCRFDHKFQGLRQLSSKERLDFWNSLGVHATMM